MHWYILHTEFRLSNPMGSPPINDLHIPGLDICRFSCLLMATITLCMSSVHGSRDPIYRNNKSYDQWWIDLNLRPCWCQSKHHENQFEGNKGLSTSAFSKDLTAGTEMCTKYYGLRVYEQIEKICFMFFFIYLRRISGRCSCEVNNCYEVAQLQIIDGVGSILGLLWFLLEAY